MIDFYVVYVLLWVIRYCTVLPFLILNCSRVRAYCLYGSHFLFIFYSRSLSRSFTINDSCQYELPYAEIWSTHMHTIRWSSVNISITNIQQTLFSLCLRHCRCCVLAAVFIAVRHFSFGFCLCHFKLNIPAANQLSSIRASHWCRHNNHISEQHRLHTVRCEYPFWWSKTLRSLIFDQWYQH